MSELNHSVKERAYPRPRPYFPAFVENMKCGEVESVEWEKFRDTVMECTNDVSGMRRAGGQRRKGSEWWNEEVGRVVVEKRRAF